MARSSSAESDFVTVLPAVLSAAQRGVLSWPSRFITAYDDGEKPLDIPDPAT